MKIPASALNNPDKKNLLAFFEAEIQNQTRKDLRAPTTGAFELSRDKAHSIYIHTLIYLTIPDQPKTWYGRNGRRDLDADTLIPALTDLALSWSRRPVPADVGLLTQCSEITTLILNTTIDTEK